MAGPGEFGTIWSWCDSAAKHGGPLLLQGRRVLIPNRLGCVHFQVPQRLDACLFSSVPSQPVPPLARTLQGYLKALEPLLPPEELKHTRRMVQEFGRAGGLGPQLQEGLERRAMLTKNWVRVRVGVCGKCDRWCSLIWVCTKSAAMFVQARGSVHRLFNLGFQCLKIWTSFVFKSPRSMRG